MTSKSDDATHSLEASLLGAVLVDNQVLALLPNLAVSDFLHARHREVFAAMRNLEARNTPIDVVTVQAEIAKSAYRLVDGEDRDKSASAAEYAFLGQLALHVPAVSNAVEYAKQIKNVSLARRIRLTLSELLEQDPNDGAELLSMAWAALSQLDEDQPDAAIKISDLVRKRFAQLDQIAQERISGQMTMTGYPTGVVKLDEKLGGWQPGIVSIVAARPGSGKSSLGLATADASSTAGFGVHLFSLEDTEEAYADRTISRSSSVPAEKLRNSTLDRGDVDRISRAHIGLRGRRWLVDSRSGVTADEIVRSVRRHKKMNNTKVAIVDYIQLVKHPNRKPRLSTHEALSEIVTTFADAAKHDKIAYVVMSQLNRELEKRQDKRPQLADLRESGSLEERAKCVVAIYRGSMYGPPVKGIDWHPSWEGRDREPSLLEFEATAQLLALKNSNGRTGTIFANWRGETTTIS